MTNSIEIDETFLEALEEVAEHLEEKGDKTRAFLVNEAVRILRQTMLKHHGVEG